MTSHADHTSPRRAALYLGLLVAVLSISCAAIFFRKAAPTPPLVMAGVRLSLASMVLWPVAWFHARSQRVPRRVWLYGGLAGTLYGVHFGTWVTSLTLTSVASSVTLVAATPLFLAVHAVVTGRDKPTARLWLSLVTAILGMGLIGSNDLGVGQSALLGDGLALIGAVAMAIYLLVSRSLGEDMRLWAFAAMATTVGALSMLALAVVRGDTLAPPSVSSFGWILAAALIPQLIGHTTLTWAVRYLPPVTVGLVTLGEPVFSTFLGWLALGEAVGPLVATGCGITLLSFVLALRA